MADGGYTSDVAGRASGLCGFGRRLQQIIYDVSAGYLVISHGFRAALMIIDELRVVKA